MATVWLRVSTGGFGAGTWVKVSVSIVGTRGESPPLPLDHLGKEFTERAKEDFEVTVPQDVGPVLLLGVYKAPQALPRPLGPLASNAWFGRWFQLTPAGAALVFPCYQWLEGAGSPVLQEGTGKISRADQQALRAPPTAPGGAADPAGDVQLLIPHTRYTLHINTLGRELFFAPNQVVDRSTGLGIGGFSELLQRNMEQLSYSTPCLPEDIQTRGVEDIPSYHYWDDRMQIWGAVECFVSEIIGIYYPSDVSVFDDSELQAWVWEIFSEGFLGWESSAPSPTQLSLQTKEALVQYVTMVIFTCSAKHSSISKGQVRSVPGVGGRGCRALGLILPSRLRFDFGAWMPNLPPTMQLPPPTSKGQARLEGFIATLPLVSATCDVIIALWLLSKEPRKQRPLGNYPDEHFTEEAPQRSISAFQSHLAQISWDIQKGHQGLALPYTYLDPPLIDNSVAT
ncbi:LOW QUALITY PROTEIN: polyunsaturated fatty acid lipoxygenase ALOX15B-like [Trichechus inunguis]